MNRIDCQTNFTLFGKHSACNTPEKSVAEVRTSIYQFQQRLDSEFDEHDGGMLDEEEEEEQAPLPAFPPKIEKPKKSHVAAPKNFFESLFTATTRRPVRPQLHTFI